jgi:hypothetical protein
MVRSTPLWKGYGSELMGCVFAAGGMPILFPVVLGGFLLLAALLLPTKRAAQVNVNTGDSLQFTGNITNFGTLQIGKNQEIIATLSNSGRIELRDLAVNLETLSKAILGSQHLSEVQKAEQLGMVNQLGEEANKPQPNKALLKVLGEGLLATLKVVPDVAKAAIAVAPLVEKLWQ